MKSFESYDSLLSEIEQDREVRGGQIGRYPVRVILLDDFEKYKSLVGDLCARVIELSALMEHDNYWFGMNALIDIVKAQEDNAVIVPISEVIRFYNDDMFNGFLSTVLLMQNTHKIRIYIPLVGVGNRFNKFWASFNRKSEGPPVWNLQTTPEEQKKICVYSCVAEMETVISSINSNRDWLDYWKSERDTPLIAKNQSIIRRWNEFLPNGCFEKDSIENPKDVLSKILRIHFSRAYRDNEAKFWKKLLADCDETRMLRDMFPAQVLERILGIQSIANMADLDLLEKYLKSDEYSRWIVIMLLEQLGAEESYLRIVMRNLDSLDDFSIVNGLYLDVFEPGRASYASERKRLIESLPSCYQAMVSKFIEQILNWLEAPEHGIELCTTYSIEEREYLALKVAENQDFPRLWDLYPELAAYMNWRGVKAKGEGIPQEFIDYFQSYNSCKLMNEISPEFEAMFEELNADKDSFYKWYYGLPELGVADGYKMVQFDGLGAEWLPYILYCVELYLGMYSKEVESCELRRVELPSTTSKNRINEALLIKDFDAQIIHKASGYDYPRSLIESLDLIKELVRVHVMLAPEAKICITADHGASFMCSKNHGAINMHKDLEAKHEGRYYEGEKKIPDNQYFFNVGEYFVAFKHHVISTNVRREVHGGACPEEVLVPYILVSKTEAAIKQEYSVQLSNHSLSFDARKLDVTISPKPDCEPEFWCDESPLQTKLFGKAYELDLSAFEPGKHQLRIKIKNNTKTESIDIGFGFVEEDLFDD